MNCPNNDQDILLLVHGELPMARRFALQAHVARCPVCKKRIDAFTAASGHIASAVRDPRMQSWSLATAPSVMATARKLAMAKALLIAMAIVIAAGVTVAKLASLSQRSQQQAYHQSVPCVPGLKSDRCR